MPGKAYSYLRFSTAEQLRGDSLRRQTEAAAAYAQQHGLALDTELTFRDMGVSAFRGANAVEGALGQFVAAVDDGKVAPGSVLLVENLDRLSRDKILPALNRFSSLLEKGVVVVTLSDGKRYDHDSLNHLPDLMLSLLVMSRAHEESEMKSRRLRAAWQNKRDKAALNGHKLTSMCPAWLRLGDGGFEVIEERAGVVRKMFEMALAGHGVDSIARSLNEEGVEPFVAFDRRANGWHPSYVRKILFNPAVIGQYQPMKRVWVEGKRSRQPDGPVIEGYFPAVVDEATFYRFKRARPGVSGKGAHPLSNLLSGLVFCSLCGGKLHYISKGPLPKGGTYLACDNARRKRTCDAKSVRYEMVKSMVLRSIEGELLLRHLAPTSNSRLKQAQDRQAMLEAVISETEQSISNLLDSLQRVSSPAIERRIAQQEQQLAMQREQLASVKEHLSAGEDDLQDVLATLTHMAANGELSLPKFFVQVNFALKKIIDRIDVALNEYRETVAWITLLNGEKFKLGGWPVSDGIRFMRHKGDVIDGPFAD